MHRSKMPTSDSPTPSGGRRQQQMSVLLLQAPQQSFRLSFSPTGIPALADQPQPGAPVEASVHLQTASDSSLAQAHAEAPLPGTMQQPSPKQPLSTFESPAFLPDLQNPAVSPEHAARQDQCLQELHRPDGGKLCQLGPAVHSDAEPAAALLPGRNADTAAADMDLTFTAPALQSSPLTNLSTPVLLRPSPPASAADSCPPPKYGYSAAASAPFAEDSSSVSHADASPMPATSPALVNDASCVVDVAYAALAAAEPLHIGAAASTLSKAANDVIDAEQPCEMARLAGNAMSQRYLSTAQTAAELVGSKADTSAAAETTSIIAARSHNSAAAKQASGITTDSQSPGNTAAVVAWLNALATSTSAGIDSRCSTPSQLQQLTSMSATDETAKLQDATPAEAPTVIAHKLQPKQEPSAVSAKLSSAGSQQEIPVGSQVAPATAPGWTKHAGSMQADLAVPNQATPVTVSHAPSANAEATPLDLLQQIVPARARHTVMSGLTTPASAVTQMHR